ncbi:pde-4_1 [Blepharisma stoltei]|uniref:Phosphodiesterase n=1 Tax=Blepharisma stoltei TaxID=1481888 RepID=A0AAU9IRD1_9CILI|nr:unnamed protein product [Blepharisma stoltei]
MKHLLFAVPCETIQKLLYLTYAAVAIIWASFDGSIGDDGVTVLNSIELGLLILIIAVVLYNILSNFNSINFTTQKLLSMIITVVCLIMSLTQLSGAPIRNKSGIKGIFLVFKLILADIAMYDMLTSKENFHKSQSSVEVINPIDGKLAEILNNAMKLASNANDKDLMSEISLYFKSVCYKSPYEIEPDEKIEDKRDEAASLIGWNFSLKLDETSHPIDPQDIVPEAFHSSRNQDLDQLETFEFDIFRFNEENNHNGLQIIMNHLFNKFDLFNSLNIPQKQFRKFILRIQSGYKSENAYHNSTHAADVVQAFHFLLHNFDAKEICNFSLAEIAICYISASIHDYQHPGLTNFFLINTQHKLAMLYNDTAVLENFHVSSAFNLIMKPSTNIFVDMDPASIKLFRSKIISLVLATDMSKHFEEINRFENLIKSQEIASEGGKSTMMELLMHFCDISNVFRPYEICRKWAELISQEFFLQGDQEKELGILLSPTCDRNNVIIPKAQLSFIANFIDPFLNPMKTVFPKFENLVVLLDKNKEELQKSLAESSGI